MQCVNTYVKGSVYDVSRARHPKATSHRTPNFWGDPYYWPGPRTTEVCMITREGGHACF